MSYNLRSLTKFSIRDVLILTLVVAMALGWWVDRQGLARWGSAMERDRERAVWETEALKRGVEGLGVDVTINSEGVHTTRLDPHGGRSQNSQFFHPKLAK